MEFNSKYDELSNTPTTTILPFKGWFPMKLKGSNIARFKEFAVDLPGVTLIAGNNGMGKSTITKALYTTLKGNIFLPQELGRQKIEEIRNLLNKSSLVPEQTLLFSDEVHENPIYSSAVMDTVGTLSQMLQDNKNIHLHYNEIYKKTQELLNSEDFRNSLKARDTAERNSYLKNFLVLLKTQVDNSPSEYVLRVLNRLVSKEFEHQTTSFSHQRNGSDLHLKDGDNTLFMLKIKEEQVEKYERAPQNLIKNILYIDEELSISALMAHLPSSTSATINGNSFSNSHVQDIIACITEATNKTHDLMDEKDIDDFSAKYDSFLQDIIHGNLELSHGMGQYVFRQDSGEMVLLRNEASGVKTFALLRLLIKNGLLAPGTCLIYNEPESHLHPEWQIKMAELFVRMAKEAHTCLVLNTHSPFFVEAVRSYSLKYDAENITKFYLAVPDGSFTDTSVTTSILQDVTDDLTPMYDSMAHPYKILDKTFMERFS